MMARLIVAVISVILEEAALVVLVRYGLTRLGIEIPLVGLAIMMIAWLMVSVVIYRVGSRALRKKPLISLPVMVGCKGKVVSQLTPEGAVKIKGELWTAKSNGRKIGTGEEVIVSGQDGLKLIVRKVSPKGS
ncbi:NfeD family protein [Chloroflexota bacterium]